MSARKLACVLTCAFVACTPHAHPRVDSSPVPAMTDLAPSTDTRHVHAAITTPVGETKRQDRDCDISGVESPDIASAVVEALKGRLSAMQVRVGIVRVFHATPRRPTMRLYDPPAAPKQDDIAHVLIDPRAPGGTVLTKRHGVYDIYCLHTRADVGETFVEIEQISQVVTD